MNIIPPAGGESGGGGNALPVKEVIGGEANSITEKELTAFTDYYIYVPYINTGNPPTINGNQAYVYLYDTIWANSITDLPANCILKIKLSADRSIYANNGVIFILDM